MKKALKFCSILLLSVCILGVCSLGSGVDLPGPIGQDANITTYYL